jgi:hypothetical protein
MESVNMGELAARQIQANEDAISAGASTVTAGVR